MLTRWRTDAVSMSDGFDLIVAFDRDTPDFARGVEVGILWQRLQTDPRPLTAVVHASNVEMTLRLAEAVGASAHADDLGDDWLTVTLA